jgi:hypothetical protein
VTTRVSPPTLGEEQRLVGRAGRLAFGDEDETVGLGQRGDVFRFLVGCDALEAQRRTDALRWVTGAGQADLDERTGPLGDGERTAWAARCESGEAVDAGGVHDEGGDAEHRREQGAERGREHPSIIAKAVVPVTRRRKGRAVGRVST